MEIEMITSVNGENPIGSKGYSAILGGVGSDGDTYMLSAYFLLPYTYSETVNPKWWQVWKKPTVTIIETDKWQCKSCMLYGWQVRSIMGSEYDLDVASNEKLQTLLFVMGGGEVYGVTLEALTTHTNYVESSKSFDSTQWNCNTITTKE